MLSLSCKKPYAPDVIAAPNSYLVVEGIINTADSTKIKLSRTINLSAKDTGNAVVGATVKIESSGGNTWQLSETPKGIYVIGGVTLDNTLKYRLRINTAGSNEYLSDFVEAKITPPIDSVGYNRSRTGLQIYATTHDDNNNTRYYRFDYTETWQFHSQYRSTYVSNNVAIVPRRPDQDIYNCFSSHQANVITLASSAKLTKDLIYQAPIVSIDSTSEKIETRYSILINEYALTADAYKFWESLRKNTEQLGSIFDAQPTAAISNIHSTGDAKEPVIGYISAGTIRSKRIYINNGQLPGTWLPKPLYVCQLDSIWYKNGNVYNVLIQQPYFEIPVAAFFNDRNPVGFIATVRECVDCTIRGTKKKPDFWK